MQRRMSGGLAYTLAYTWSKALGDFLDHLSAGGGATGNAPRAPNRERRGVGRAFLGGCRQLQAQPAGRGQQMPIAAHGAASPEIHDNTVW
jgi:hypothetical protein